MMASLMMSHRETRQSSRRNEHVLHLEFQRNEKPNLGLRYENSLINVSLCEISRDVEGKNVMQSVHASLPLPNNTSAAVLVSIFIQLIV